MVRSIYTQPMCPVATRLPLQHHCTDEKLVHCAVRQKPCIMPAGLQEAAEVRGAWKEVADENRNLNRQQHALSEEAGRLKERCETLKQAIGKVNLDLADANVEAKKLSAEIVEVGAASLHAHALHSNTR